MTTTAGSASRSIAEDKNGKFWFSNTLNRIDVEPPAANAPTPAGQGTGELRYRREPGVGGANDDHAWFMSPVKDRSGDLWLATLGAGVWRYDGTRMTHDPVLHDKPIWAYSIYQDRQGVLWLGTLEHGVYRFNEKAFDRFKP